MTDALGLDDDLRPDPGLFAGGMRAHDPGTPVRALRDDDVHTQLMMPRVVKSIIYLTPDWGDNDDGLPRLMVHRPSRRRPRPDWAHVSAVPQPLRHSGEWAGMAWRSPSGAAPSAAWSRTYCSPSPPPDGFERRTMAPAAEPEGVA